jgi:NTP pyrophosphatase (non-canonical NTP hydrolase)
MTVYRDIYDRISTSSPAQVGPDGPLWRLLKIQEEAGEVAEAAIGFVGANKRKGFTHSSDEVAKELADVVVTAMIAMHDWTGEPEQFMKDHLQGLLARIREGGS